MKSPDRNKCRRNGLAPWVFIAPALLLLFCVTIIPLGYAMGISFMKYNLARPASAIRFCGFDNYISILGNEDFANATLWTLSYAGIVSAVEIVLGMAIALALSAEHMNRLSRPFKTILIIPMMVGGAICGTIWKLMLYPMYGVVTCLGKQLGLGAIDWLGTPQYSKLALIMVSIWGATPMCLLILMAALMTVPTDISEAARIDGANTPQQFFHITLPSIRNFVALVVTLRVGDALRSFENVMTLTGGGPAKSTETIGAVIYRIAFTKSNTGQGSAASFLFFILVSVISVILMKAIQRGDQNGAARA